MEEIEYSNLGCRMEFRYDYLFVVRKRDMIEVT